MQASNATFLVDLSGGTTGRQAIHKPVAGEKPLWDFPTGTLGHRELAAYELSNAAGYHVVPRTVWVEEGPVGPGMLQAWVETDEASEVVDLVPVAQANRPGWFRIFTGVDAHEQPVAVVHADHPQLRRLALFDVVINNGDRKGGHILVSEDAVLGVDHGVAFHVEPKLRTLLWGWAGSALRPDEIELLHGTLAIVEDTLRPWLERVEIEATRQRIEQLLTQGCFPEPGDDWPTIPWPPF